MAFVAYTSGEIDADSPLDEAFFLKMSNNFDALVLADVTNGDSHNHVGGDGAAIPISAGLDMVIQSDGIESIDTVSTWTPSAGVYNMLDLGTGGDLKLELNVDSTWRTPSQEGLNGTIFCDGTNVRISNPSGGSVNVYWQKF